jgi:hypothetical protein
MMLRLFGSACILAIISSCSDQDGDRPHLNIQLAALVPLDPDRTRIERRSLADDHLPAPARAAAGANSPVPTVTGLAPSPLPTIEISPADLAASIGDHPLAAAGWVEIADLHSSIGDHSTASPVSADAAAPPPIWHTTPGLTLRQTIAAWLPLTGGKFQLAPAHDAEPLWTVAISDSTTGDFFQALTWLRAGFPEDPRPDIEVTANGVVIIRTLGAS